MDKRTKVMELQKSMKPTQAQIDAKRREFNVQFYLKLKIEATYAQPESK
jgi:hypothetical protein